MPYPAQMTPTTAPPMPRWLRRVLWAGAVMAVLGLLAAWAGYRWADRTPGELLRYAERRLLGHNKLEAVALPVFAVVRPFIEREPFALQVAAPRGQQAHRLPPQRYDAQGRPLPSKAVAAAVLASPAATQRVQGVDQLLRAVRQAQPGDVIELAPGRYPIKGNVNIDRPGLAGAPVVLRAERVGQAVLEFNALEGFFVQAPYWVFEDLTIVGKCSRHQDCEHAFHVVMKARNTVIRNNLVEDFNAHIKVNGHKGQWPDDGLVQFNTLRNSAGRDTHFPVTPIDIVAANRWVVVDNTISDFVKLHGNLISYGVFMKGAGEGGRIERNTIVCTSRDISQPGVRVGASFGGGGTGAPYCRDKKCLTEHTLGVLQDNDIAHCNDFGIYINQANQTTIAGNRLLNTAGIDVRFPNASATVTQNVVEGRIRSRDGGVVEASGNEFP